ncbi:deoxyribose-phosphate aldolase [Knoellia sp. S7-12]|uniref:Cgl0159 family (beta/alpha)8-fold protein n=1 Tax=Knoellia sp. S7-12 TaxID=3126698 RepID=UPI003366414B
MSSVIDTAAITASRLRDPGAIARAWADRRPSAGIPADGRLLLLAADHPARGALAVRDQPRAMASRPDLLERLAIALQRPGVDGVLGTPDVLEDLLLAGLLENRLVIGSMNRGGLQGSTFELDDRFTAYDAPTIAEHGLSGGKMLTRICLEDDGSAATLEASGAAVSALAARGLMAMVEPFLSVRRSRTRVENLLDPDSVIASMAIASGLGASSAHTWLKLPVVAEMERVLETTTLPCLLLGGDPTGDREATYRTWGSALACPSAAGLVVGRALLFPPDGDVATAVDTAADLVHGGAQ